MIGLIGSRIHVMHEHAVMPSARTRQRLAEMAHDPELFAGHDVNACEDKPCRGCAELRVVATGEIGR